MAADRSTPDLRASDSDREATVGRLRIAAMEGRLDADELADRVSAAFDARWCTELERLTADVTPVAPQPAWGPPAPPVFVAPGQRVSGLAIASLVSGLVWMGWIGSILAVVLGHTALRRIARSNGRKDGRGLAIAGLVLGYLELAMLALILAFAT